MHSLFTISSDSIVPVYQQLENEIIDSVDSGKLTLGARLPSINELARQCNVAAGTIHKAYDSLRRKGIVASRQGKGFYIASLNTSPELRVFVLFDRMNAYKEILYEALLSGFGKKATLDIYFHHYDLRRFRNLIAESVGNYHHYIIMPHFNTDVGEIVKQLPATSLMLIDKRVASLNEGYSWVAQDFENDIYRALEQAGECLKKYSEIVLVRSKSKFQFVPAEIEAGLLRFCSQHSITGSITEEIGIQEKLIGKAFVLFSDNDLVALLKRCKAEKLTAGRDTGIISYDDTPMKELLAGGITVVSTDFQHMGRTVATAILEKRACQIANPSQLLIRESL